MVAVDGAGRGLNLKTDGQVVITTIFLVEELHHVLASSGELEGSGSLSAIGVVPVAALGSPGGADDLSPDGLAGLD